MPSCTHPASRIRPRPKPMPIKAFVNDARAKHAFPSDQLPCMLIAAARSASSASPPNPDCRLDQLAQEHRGNPSLILKTNCLKVVDTFRRAPCNWKTRFARPMPMIVNSDMDVRSSCHGFNNQHIGALQCHQQGATKPSAESLATINPEPRHVEHQDCHDFFGDDLLACVFAQSFLIQIKAFSEIHTRVDA